MGSISRRLTSSLGGLRPFPAQCKAKRHHGLSTPPSLPCVTRSSGPISAKWLDTRSRFSCNSCFSCFILPSFYFFRPFFDAPAGRRASRAAPRGGPRVSACSQPHFCLRDAAASLSRKLILHASHISKPPAAPSSDGVKGWFPFTLYQSRGFQSSNQSNPPTPSLDFKAPSRFPVAFSPASPKPSACGSSSN